MLGLNYAYVKHSMNFVWLVIFYLFSSLNGIKVINGRNIKKIGISFHDVTITDLIAIKRPSNVNILVSIMI